MSVLDEHWSSLVAERERLAEFTLLDLFGADSRRFQRLSVRDDHLLLDVSKQRLDEQALQSLVTVAEAADLAGWRERLFSGAAINDTENRPALHTALRADDATVRETVGSEVADAIAAAKARMAALVAALRDGSHAGAGGEPITDVVHIGIGGSDLGPRLVLDVLADQAGGPAVHFVTNVDGEEIHRVTQTLNPARTLFVVVSKSFGTQETLSNAEAGVAWLKQAGIDGPDLAKHLIAVTANVDKAGVLGVAEENVLPIWDWVGGRYSIWSAVALPVAIACGMPAFEALLRGARAMDAHFQQAPLARNMPVLLALVGIWNRDVMGWPALAVVPYSERLCHFPNYLQQLDMESCGKSVGRQGEPLQRPTSPVIFGQTGTNGQHAFFQALHQGTDVVPVDFIGVARSCVDMPDHHRKLLSNLLAQSAALMTGQSTQAAAEQLRAQGKDLDEAMRLAPFKTFPGNRPSTTILLRRLDAEGIGRLIALYEHKVFCQSVLWGLNPFDQWGVELGKQMAGEFLAALSDGELPDSADGSSRGLLAACKDWF